MKNRSLTIVLIIITALTGLAPAETELTDKKVHLSGLAAFEAGQFQQGSYFKPVGITYKKQWLSRTQFNATLRTVINPHLAVSGGLEVECLAPFYHKYVAPGLSMVWYNAYMTEAQGVFTFDKGENRFLLGIGKFDFKYNPDSRDLGEYLFRSTPYPQTVWTDFDFSMVRLTGFHLKHTLGGFEQQLLFYTATDHFPLWDWTPSYLASFNVKGIVEAGAGASLYHLLSVNPDLTRPNLRDEYRNNVPAADRKFYIDANGDSLQVPFSGTMLMGRISFDIKKLLLGNNGFFGSEDLKLYSEAAVLGVKNYPMTDTLNQPSYAFDDIKNRIPIMFGFNLPAFRLLDVFACEMEYWSNPYPNSLEDVIRSNQASPGLMNGNGMNYRPEDYKYHWKWSLYLKKTMYSSFQTIAMVANDHYFTRNPGDQASSIQDFEQAFRKNGDWYWMMKLRFLF